MVRVGVEVSCVDRVVCRVVVQDAGRFCAGAASVAAPYEFPAAGMSARWLHLVAPSGNRTQESDSTSRKTTALQVLLKVEHCFYGDCINVGSRCIIDRVKVHLY